MTVQKPTIPTVPLSDGGEQERDFQVEEDEQDRHEVIAHVELHARVFERLEAALVGESFSA